ncbi:hypothetical protein PMAYCL1PPCAC_30356, partial [Pristionchus mayeri]
MFLLPDYACKMVERDAIVKSLTNTDVTEEANNEVITKFRDPEEFERQKDAPFLEIESQIPELRQYQKELIKEADAGKNTVIVAPTGSGKTVVAAYIIRQHIESRRDEGQGARVALVAPTVPLVEQHGRELYRCLKDVAYMDYLHGNFQLSETDRINSLLSNNLVILTPQLLINCLQSVRSEGRLFVADFSLLILDECHHTCENHPYAQLMTLVRSAKNAAKENNGDIPQIVGMTASLGIGKNGLKDVNNGVGHVKRLMANMGATCISTVVNHTEELERHVNRPTDQMDEISRPPLKDCPFTQKILECIDELRSFITKSLDPSEISKFDWKVTFQSLKEIQSGNSPRFKGTLNHIKQFLENKMLDGRVRSQLIDAVDMILAYLKTLDMNDLLPASKALSHMCDEMKKKMSENNEYLNKFREKYRIELKRLEGYEEDKRMLAKLREEVLSMRGDSRCIVFVETREVCKHLADYIQGILPTGNNCGYIMSTSKGNSLINQSSSEQMKTLNDFKEGRISVIVATSVANEGIDVPQCNLIIKYNMTG